MWVVLVVAILQKEYDHGRIRTLQRKLKAIPKDLHELFRNILTRDRHNKDELLLCIQWVLFARQPLRPEQLYFAILSGTASDWGHHEIDESGIKRSILSSSKGLVEITNSNPHPTVQFIHESVRDFLYKENGLIAIWPEMQDNFQGQSHERLKNCCLGYMRVGRNSLDIDDALVASLPDTIAEARQSAEKTFPFLEYAVRNVFYHADMAEGSGVDQTEFLKRFQFIDWIELECLIEKHATRRHKLSTSPLYLLAEYNAGHLISRHPDKLSCFREEDERYGMPLFAALATDSRRAVLALVKAHADENPTLARLLDEFEQSYQKKPVGNLGRSFRF